MKDYKQLFGYAAIIFGIGFVIRSFLPAHAFNGPNISTGSNPITNFYGQEYLSPGAGPTLFTNTSSGSYIITQYLSSQSWCSIQIDGQSVLSHYHNTWSSANVPGATDFRGTIAVPAGSTVSIKNIHPNSNKNCGYYMEGYFAH